MRDYELLDRSAALRRPIRVWKTVCAVITAASAVAFVALIIEAATSSDSMNMSAPAAAFVFMFALLIGAVWAAGRAATQLVGRTVHRLRSSDVAS